MRSPREVLNDSARRPEIFVSQLPSEGYERSSEDEGRPIGLEGSEQDEEEEPPSRQTGDRIDLHQPLYVHDERHDVNRGETTSGTFLSNGSEWTPGQSAARSPVQP